MKKYVLLLSSLFLLAACGNSTTTSSQSNEPAVEEVEESTTYEETEESSVAETEESSGPDYVIKEKPNHPEWSSTYRAVLTDERGRKYPADLPDMEYAREEGVLYREFWRVYDTTSTRKYFVDVATVNGKPLTIITNKLGLEDSQIASFLNSSDGAWDLLQVDKISEEEVQEYINNSYHNASIVVDERWNIIE